MMVEEKNGSNGYENGVNGGEGSEGYY